MPTEPADHLQAPPGLLALARERMRTRHLALRTEQAYLQWLGRYVTSHHRRHPREERRRARPGVTFPFALARKYPAAGTRWGW